MRSTLALATLITAATLALTACGTTTEPAAENKPTELTDEQRASIKAEAGLPDLNPQQRDAFVEALNAIKTDIVHGKPDKAISRGINQCSSIKRKYDDAKLVDLANSRFSSPTNPSGHGQAIAARINAAAHKHLCPDY